MERIGLNEAMSSWHCGEQQVHWICVKSTVILLLVTSTHLPALSSAPSTIHLTSQAVVSLKSSESTKLLNAISVQRYSVFPIATSGTTIATTLCSIV